MAVTSQSIRRQPESVQMKTWRSGTFFLVLSLNVTLVAAWARSEEPPEKPASPSIADDKALLVDRHQTPATRAAAAKRLRLAAIKDPNAKVLPDLLRAIKNEPDAETRVEII